MSALAEIEREMRETPLDARTAEDYQRWQAIAEEHTVSPAFPATEHPLARPAQFDDPELQQLADEQFELEQAYLEHEGYDLSDFRPPAPRPVLSLPRVQVPQTIRPRPRASRARRVVRRVARRRGTARAPSDPSEPDPPLGGSESARADTPECET